MPSIDSPLCVEREPVAGTRNVFSRAMDHPAGRAWRLLRDFLAGLDKLLKLGDFSRGDCFRD